jgi:ribosome-associated protein
MACRRSRSSASNVVPVGLILPAAVEAAIEERFLAGTGPGGQNVNKVATAVQLRLNVFDLGLPPSVFARLRGLAGSRLTGAGELLITARRFRTREANRAEARARLDALLRAAHLQPERRIATKPGRAAQQRRVEGKARRADVKRGRQRPMAE